METLAVFKPFRDLHSRVNHSMPCRIVEAPVLHVAKVVNDCTAVFNAVSIEM